MPFRGSVSRRQPKRSFMREVIIPGALAFLMMGLLWLAIESGLIREGTTALMSLLQPGHEESSVSGSLVQPVSYLLLFGTPAA